MKFMVVDDSNTMRKIVGLALKSKGYEIIEAENGQDALNKAQAEKIDFFIVDVNMPVMNGIVFIQEIRKKPEYANIPIIILTTETEEDLKSKGKAAGANAWIVKPFQNEEFLSLIDKLKA